MWTRFGVFLPGAGWAAALGGHAKALVIITEVRALALGTRVARTDAFKARHHGWYVVSSISELGGISSAGAKACRRWDGEDALIAASKGTLSS